MNIDGIIKRAIQNAISSRVNRDLETFVRNEVARELKRHGIGIRRTAREINNRSNVLYEIPNLRRSIGSLSMNRIKDGIAENLRFKLSGIESRLGTPVINESRLKSLIDSALKEKVRRMR